MNTNLSPRPSKIIDEEVKWDKSQIIISKTDLHGTILYMNDAFEEASEYNKVELIGEPHNIIRHPDMPKVVFKVLWEQAPVDVQGQSLLQASECGDKPHRKNSQVVTH